MSQIDDDATNPAPTVFSVLEVIKKRWSPRALQSTPLKQGDICSILEAGHWAASAFNEQPWRIVMGDTTYAPETHALLRQIMVPFNDSWAGKAPLLMLTVAKTRYTHTGEPNAHAWHDVGQMVAQMVLQATSLGIYAHQMAGIDPEKAYELLGIPRGEFEPVTMIAFGYVASPNTLPEQLRERETAPRMRKPLQEVVFSRHWQGANPICNT